MSARVAKRDVTVTERDLALLRSLGEYRYLSVEQVERLHFPSQQTATRRLRLLAGAGWIEVFRVPTVGVRLACLAAAGERLLRDSGAVSMPEPISPRREQPKDALFLRHFLAISDFRIGLERAARESRGLDLLGFLPEHVTRPGKGGAPEKMLTQTAPDFQMPKRQIAHCPDGAFALSRGGSAALFFLEIDRGTEVIGDPERGVLKAVRFYLSALLADSHQRLAAEFGAAEPFKGFRTLFVVSSQQRLENIRQRAGAVPCSPESAKRFLWLCPASALARASPLEVSWVSLDPEDQTAYTIAPKERAERREQWQSA